VIKGLEVSMDRRSMEEEVMEDELLQKRKRISSRKQLHFAEVSEGSESQATSRHNIDAARYADVESPDLTQHVEADDSIVGFEESTSHTKHNTHISITQAKSTRLKRSRPNSSNSSNTTRPTKQPRPMDLHSSPPSKFTATPLTIPRHASHPHAASPPAASPQAASPDTLQAQLRSTSAALAAKTKEALDLRARLSAATPRASLDAAALRSQVRTLTDEARARALLVQEYLASWQRADEEAGALRARLADSARAARQAERMADALRRKADRDAKALQRVVADHDALLQAAERLVRVEAVRAMACGELGEVGEALDGLLQVVLAQRRAGRAAGGIASA